MKVRIQWERVFHEDYGYDHDVVVDRGEIIIEAANIAAAQLEVERCANAQTNYREGIQIEAMEAYEGPEEAGPIGAIQRLLDPYGSVGPTSNALPKKNDGRYWLDL